MPNQGCYRLFVCLWKNIPSVKKADVQITIAQYLPKIIYNQAFSLYEIVFTIIVRSSQMKNT